MKRNHLALRMLLKDAQSKKEWLSEAADRLGNFLEHDKHDLSKQKYDQNKLQVGSVPRIVLI